MKAAIFELKDGKETLLCNDTIEKGEDDIFEIVYRDRPIIDPYFGWLFRKNIKEFDYKFIFTDKKGNTKTIFQKSYLNFYQKDRILNSIHTYHRKKMKKILKGQLKSRRY